MNTEYRNKLYNRIKDVFEKEDTQERQGFLEARENFERRFDKPFLGQILTRGNPYVDIVCGYRTPTINSYSYLTPGPLPVLPALETTMDQGSRARSCIAIKPERTTEIPQQKR